MFDALLPPDEPLPWAIKTEAERATLFAALLTVAFGDDIEAQLRGGYGFPVDHDQFVRLLPQVRRRAAHGVLLRG